MRNRTENKMTLVLIRHGATTANMEHRYLGRADEELACEGISEVVKYAGLGYYPEVDILFSSPMKRCIQTAEIIYPAKQPACINEWIEMDFGDFEGKNYIELQGDKRYQDWIDSNAMLPFPNGESREAFTARCEAGFIKMRDKIRLINDCESIKSIGIIAHGGTIMALLSSLADGSYFDYQVKNARGYICTIEDFYGRPHITECKKI